MVKEKVKGFKVIIQSKTVKRTEKLSLFYCCIVHFIVIDYLGVGLEQILQEKLKGLKRFFQKVRNVEGSKWLLCYLSC